MQIDIIAGTRPNFVKIAALMHAFTSSFKIRLIHTGQHYDKNLSDSFFDQLEIPEPDVNLGIGSGSQAYQTGAIMKGYEELLTTTFLPDLCIVVGDVTSSMACAITAKKMRVKVAHVEAGIRSGDMAMPEEVNRILIDAIADYFFTTTRQASELLIKQGKDPNKVFFVGNTMIDTLLKFQTKLKQPKIWKDLNLTVNSFLVLTLHRPANVDEEENIKNTLLAIIQSSKDLPLIFPAHPRTALKLKAIGIQAKNLHIISSLSYLEFNYLVKHAKGVITDSGGITEETTVMGIPCITLRDNTERPETISIGTNELIGTDTNAIPDAMNKLLQGNWKKGGIPEYWDGKTGERIAKILASLVLDK